MAQMSQEDVDRVAEEVLKRLLHAAQPNKNPLHETIVRVLTEPKPSKYTFSFFATNTNQNTVEVKFYSTKDGTGTRLCMGYLNMTKDEWEQFRTEMGMGKVIPYNG